MANKIKKNINVSIQARKYFSPINNILQNWEEDGLNVSTEVCESILLAEKIANSPTLLSVMKLYDLTEQILYLNGVDNTEQKLEDVLSLLIKVNGEGLTDIINSSFQNTNKNKKKEHNNIETTECSTQNIKETKTKKEDDTIAVCAEEDAFSNIEYIEDDGEYSIPSDILFND